MIISPRHLGIHSAPDDSTIPLLHALCPRLGTCSDQTSKTAPVSTRIRLMAFLTGLSLSSRTVTGVGWSKFRATTMVDGVEVDAHSPKFKNTRKPGRCSSSSWRWDGSLVGRMRWKSVRRLWESTRKVKGIHDNYLYTTWGWVGTCH